jgi:hypothetical protein
MTFKQTLLYQFSFICLVLIGLVVIFLNSNFDAPRSGILDADRKIRIQEQIYAELDLKKKLAVRGRVCAFLLTGLCWVQG